MKKKKQVILIMTNTEKKILFERIENMEKSIKKIEKFLGLVMKGWKKQ